MTDIVLFLILAAVVGGAVLYIYKAKKNGAKCIGCPSGKSCSSCCGCGQSDGN